VANRTPQPGAQHPERWRDNLNPDAGAGQNDSSVHRTTRSAYDVKPLHRRLDGYRDDELQQIPILNQGERLQQGATYLDLADEQPRGFTATGDMEAGRDNCYVAKTSVDYTLWNRLTGVSDPARTDSVR
jgi:hypothetical protein